LAVTSFSAELASDGSAAIAAVVSSTALASPVAASARSFSRAATTPAAGRIRAASAPIGGAGSPRLRQRVRDRTTGPEARPALTPTPLSRALDMLTYPH